MQGTNQQQNFDLRSHLKSLKYDKLPEQGSSCSDRSESSPKSGKKREE